jgi:Mn2+/Fe2+ NRAMP family transporter
MKAGRSKRARVSASSLSALVKGLVAPPLLALVMLAANNWKIMGDQTNGPMLNLLGWTTVAVMGAVGVAFVLRGGA